MNEYDHLPDDHVPLVCPVCQDNEDETIPLTWMPNSEMVRLTLQIVLYGTCYSCGYSVACPYRFDEAVNEEEIFSIVYS